MLRAPAWALCCCLAVADGLLGCDTSCEKEDGTARAYTTGLTSPSCASYQTNGFDERYVDFPPGRRLRIEHGLGQTPSLVQSYVAFIPLPFEDEHGTAESAGNQVIIEAVNDVSIQVRNDTCEFFYLRLVALVDVPVPDCPAASLEPPAAGGAGGADGADGAGGAGG